MDTTRLSLLERVRNGDEQSWRQLVAVYQPMVRNWLVGRGIIIQDAEDLSQDVMVVLVRKLPEFQHNGRIGSFRAWLRTIVTRQTLKFLQQGRCRVESAKEGITPEYLSQLADSASDLAKKWDQDHDLFLLDQLLRLLDTDFQPDTVRIFRMLAFEGKKPDAIANESGMSIAAIYGIKSRVLARLRQESQFLLE